MEIIILAAIVLIWLIFSYEFIKTNPKKKTATKILTADEVSSTQDDIIRARSIIKNMKAQEEQKEAEQEKSKVAEGILPDPFSEQNKE